MFRPISIAALMVAGAMSTPAFAGSAADGAAYLKELNLIVFRDMSLTSEVEGKAFIGRDLLSGSGNFGVGSDANPTQGQVTGNMPILFIGRDNLTGFNAIKVKNGSNGGVGTLSIGSSAVIGRNSSALELQTGVRSLTVGRDLADAGNFPIDNVRIGRNVVNGNLGGVSGGTIRIGNSGNVNSNGATVIRPDATVSGEIATEVSTTISDVTSSVQALSTLLGGMTVVSPSNFSSAGFGLTLNAVDGGQGFALFNLTGSDLTGKQQLYLNAASNLTVVVNITGIGATPFDWGMTVETPNDDWMNQKVIWNFVDAKNITISDEFHGTLLAPHATVTAGSQMNGTVVADIFHGNAEVHLGTYNGITTFNSPPPPPPAVPEPATWAMMIGGLAVTGAALRRRRASLAFA